MIYETNQVDAPEYPELLVLPVLQGDKTDCSVLEIDLSGVLTCEFSLFAGGDPSESAYFGAAPAQYGIPAEADPAQRYLLLDVYAEYPEIAVLGGKLDGNGLTLYIAHPPQESETFLFCCAVPIPADFPADTAQYRAEFVQADAAAFQTMRKDSAEIEIYH